MSKYAVIQLQGKQYQVSEQDVLTVDRLPQAEGETFQIEEVLLVVDGDKRQIGTPIVKGAKVSITITSHMQGDKLRVFKYKSKSKYRKTQGHRQQQSVVKIDKIAA